MAILPVTERQLNAILLPAVQYKEAMVIYDMGIGHLRMLCQRYEGIEVVTPWDDPPNHEAQITLVRLLRPAQRETAMMVPYWQQIPPVVLLRVRQLRLVA